MNSFLYIRFWMANRKKLLDESNAYKSQLKTCRVEKGQLKDELAIALNDVTVLSDQIIALDSIIKQLREGDGSQLVYPYDTSNFVTQDYSWLFNCIHNYRLPFSFLPMDITFCIPSYNDTVKFLQWDATDKPPYIPEDRDCDKYARRLWARYAWLTPWNNLGFMLDLSGGHAYNAFVTEDGRLWICEPQSDSIWEFNRDTAKGIYLATNGYLLI